MFDLDTVAGCERAMDRAACARDRAAFETARRARAALLAGSQTAAARPTGRGIYGAHLASVGAASAPTETIAAPAAPPAARPAVADLPDLEAHPAVRAVRAKHAGLYDQWAAAKREREEAGAALGLTGAPTPGKAESLAVRLVAD